MAQSIRPENSVEKNEMASKRHASLCAQVPGAEVLAQAISPAITNIGEKILTFKARNEDATKASDVVIYETASLRNQLRNTADKLKGYDRDNPGFNSMAVVFPENLTPLLTMNPLETPKEVSKVVSKLQSLGSEHPAFEYIEKLNERIEKCNQSIAKYNEADGKLKLAEAELEVAHGVLIKQYNDNILEAKKMFGNVFSDHLFPKSKGSKRNPPPPPTPPSPAK